MLTCRDGPDNDPGWLTHTNRHYAQVQWAANKSLPTNLQKKKKETNYDYRLTCQRIVCSLAPCQTVGTGVATFLANLQLISNPMVDYDGSLRFWGRVRTMKPHQTKTWNHMWFHVVPWGGPPEPHFAVWLFSSLSVEDTSYIHVCFTSW